MLFSRFSLCFVLLMAISDDGKMRAQDSRNKYAIPLSGIVGQMEGQSGIESWVAKVLLGFAFASQEGSIWLIFSEFSWPI